ncbi:MAG: PEP-CTERM sorting domain-containing protein [Akkermansiaceae bacterium]|nr:PEP-CTERM sorting domain-containing protein [Akkermansiaceae bacterium]
MKTTLITAALCLGLAASASADTTTLDLLDGLTTDNATSLLNDFQTTKFTADAFVSWLGGQSDGVYCTPMNGQNTIVADTSLTSGEDGYTLSVYSRRNYGGSVAGIAATIEDTSSLTSLDLSYTNSSLYSCDIYLVYQLDGEWEIDSTTISQGETATFTVDLSDSSLTSSTVYVAVSVTGTASYRTGTISLTATSGAVPEPATATLGLLALGALALRRRRA